VKLYCYGDDDKSSKRPAMELTAAKTALAGRRTGNPKRRDGRVEALRNLRVARRSAVEHVWTRRGPSVIRRSGPGSTRLAGTRVTFQTVESERQPGLNNI
jgi:hypothetical protein